MLVGRSWRQPLGRSGRRLLVRSLWRRLPGGHERGGDGRAEAGVAPRPPLLHQPEQEVEIEVDVGLAQRLAVLVLDLVELVNLDVHFNKVFFDLERTDIINTEPTTACYYWMTELYASIIMKLEYLWAPCIVWTLGRGAPSCLKQSSALLTFVILPENNY